MQGGKGLFGSDSDDDEKDFGLGLSKKESGVASAQGLQDDNKQAFRTQDTFMDPAKKSVSG